MNQKQQKKKLRNAVLNVLIFFFLLFGFMVFYVVVGFAKIFG